MSIPEWSVALTSVLFYLTCVFFCGLSFYSTFVDVVRSNDTVNIADVVIAVAFSLIPFLNILVGCCFFLMLHKADIPDVTHWFRRKE